MSRKATPNIHPIALITGASDGIGLEFVKIMAKEGWELLITARREELLKSISEEYSQKFSVPINYLPLDLSKIGSAEILHQWCNQKNKPVSALINNAGFGLIGEFNEHPISRYVEMINLNITNLVALSHLFIPQMITQRNGWILNNASISGFLPIPYFNIYAATKAFVLSHSYATAKELEGTGVSVTCLCPGPSPTGFGRVAGYHSPNQKRMGSVPPNIVAQMGYDAMLKRKRVIIPGASTKFIHILSALLPLSAISAVSGLSVRVRMRAAKPKQHKTT